MAGGFDPMAAINAATRAQTYTESGADAHNESVAPEAALTAQDIATRNNMAMTADLANVTAANEKMSREQLNLQIAQRFGTDPGAVGSKLDEIAGRVSEADARMQDASKRIADKSRVNIFDSPIDYLINQFTVQSDIADYNKADRDYEQAHRYGTQIQQLTQTGIQTNMALLKTVSAASIAAGTAEVLGKAQLANNKAQVDSWRWGLAQINEVTQAKQQVAQMEFQKLGADRQGIELALQQAAAGRDERRLQIAELAAKDKNSEDGILSKAIGMGYAAMTGNQMDPVRMKEALALFRTGKSPQIQQWFESGISTYSLDPNGSVPVFSNSTYRAVNMASVGSLRNLSDDQEVVKKALLNYRHEFERPEVQSTYQFDPKDPQSKERAFNRFIDMKRTTGDTEKLFTPADLATVATINKNYETMPVWQKLLKPAVAAGIKLDDPKVVQSLVINGITSGKINYEEALGVSDMYAQSRAQSNAGNKYIPFGITPPTEVTGKATTGGTLNMASAKDFSLYLNKELARQASRNLMMTGRGGLGAYNATSTAQKNWGPPPLPANGDQQ